MQSVVLTGPKTCRSSRQRRLVSSAGQVSFFPMSECLWYAFQVRTQQETAVSGLLSHKGYEVFLPVYSSRRRLSDGVKDPRDAPVSRLRVLPVGSRGGRWVGCHNAGSGQHRQVRRPAGGVLLQKKSESQLVVLIPLLRRSLAVVADMSWIASKRVASAA